MESVRWDFPQRPRGLPSLLYNGYWVYSPKGKRPGSGPDRPPHLTL